VKDAIQRTINSSYESSRTTAVTTSSVGDESDLTEGPVLIIDGLDFLIALQPDVTATSISQMLTQVRQRVHATILSISSDGPLLHSNSDATAPLERAHQAFVASMAHQSQLVMQLRSLDTGTAKDVSGVIRISHGGEYEGDSQGQDQPEGEWLYKVSADGSVRVWGRGE
jgi:elongator complex protein 6